MSKLRIRTENGWQELFGDIFKEIAEIFTHCLKKEANLSDVQDPQKARESLGLVGNENDTHFHDQRYYTQPQIDKKLSDMASENDEKFSDIDAQLALKLDKYKNLSDLTDAGEARKNLGLTGTSNTTHYHDNRYYTKNEIDNKINTALPAKGSSKIPIYAPEAGKIAECTSLLSPDGRLYLGSESVYIYVK